MLESEKVNMKFGSYNVATGETQEGYMDGDLMKFNKPSFLKRILGKLFPAAALALPADWIKQLEAVEYIGTTELYSKMIWSSKKDYFTVAVYRLYSKSDNKTISLYANTSKGKMFFNKDAYDSNNILVAESEL